MKRGHTPISHSLSTTQPFIRFVLIDPKNYLISFRNIYGYMKTLLADRCKKAGAEYSFTQKGYIIASEKVADFKGLVNDVIQAKVGQEQNRIKIEEYPVEMVKTIMRKKLGKGRNQRKTSTGVAQGCQQISKRKIYLDKEGTQRYMFAVKQLLSSKISKKAKDERNHQKTQNSKPCSAINPKRSLVICTQLHKRYWAQHVSKASCSSSQGTNHPPPPASSSPTPTTDPIFIQLTYNELTKKQYLFGSKAFKLTPFQNDQSKNSSHHHIYLITYESLKYIQSQSQGEKPAAVSWLYGVVPLLSTVILDDAEMLIESDSLTLDNKEKNCKCLMNLLGNFINEEQKDLVAFVSKIPEPLNLLKLLSMIRPRNFPHNELFVNKKASLMSTKPSSTLANEFPSWFRRRYRKQSKCLVQILYLLEISSLQDLWSQSFVLQKQQQQQSQQIIIPFLQIPTIRNKTTPITTTKLQQKINLHNRICPIQIKHEIVQKFRTMDKKYRKLSADKINFKEILQNLHNTCQDDRFFICKTLSDYSINKNSKNYLIEARQLMILSKCEQMFSEIYFQVKRLNSRIVIVIEQDKLEKKLKKYLNQTQIQFCDYDLRRLKSLQNCNRDQERGGVGRGLFSINSNNQNHNNINNFHQFDNYPPFDSNHFQTKVCIINRTKLVKQIKEQKQRLKRQKKQKLLQLEKIEAHTYTYTYTQQQALDIATAADQQFYNEYLQTINPSSLQRIKLPPITTAHYIHFLDSFWYQFNVQKEVAIKEIFDFGLWRKNSKNMSMCNSMSNNNKINNNVKNNNPLTATPTPNEIIYFDKSKNFLINTFYVCEGSYEKMLLENYLSKKQQLYDFLSDSVAVDSIIESYPLQTQSQSQPQTQTQHLLIQQNYNNNTIIQYLDIDDQFDRVEALAKKLKKHHQNKIGCVSNFHLKGPKSFCENVVVQKDRTANNASSPPIQCHYQQKQQQQQQKIFLPKFSNPKQKSFKQILQQQLQKQKQVQRQRQIQIQKQCQDVTTPALATAATTTGISNNFIIQQDYNDNNSYKSNKRSDQYHQSTDAGGNEQSQSSLSSSLVVPKFNYSQLIIEQQHENNSQLDQLNNCQQQQQKQQFLKAVFETKSQNESESKHQPQSQAQVNTQTNNNSSNNSDNIFDQLVDKIIMEKYQQQKQQQQWIDRLDQSIDNILVGNGGDKEIDRVVDVKGGGDMDRARVVMEGTVIENAALTAIPTTTTKAAMEIEDNKITNDNANDINIDDVLKCFDIKNHHNNENESDKGWQSDDQQQQQQPQPQPQPQSQSQPPLQSNLSNYPQTQVKIFQTQKFEQNKRRGDDIDVDVEALQQKFKIQQEGACCKYDKQKQLRQQQQHNNYGDDDQNYDNQDTQDSNNNDNDNDNENDDIIKLQDDCNDNKTEQNDSNDDVQIVGVKLKLKHTNKMILPSEYHMMKKTKSSLKINNLFGSNLNRINNKNKVKSKELYENTISKSKQLWQKKLRKQSQKIILAQSRFNKIRLHSKPNWKQDLTNQELEQLKERGLLGNSGC